MSTAAANTPTSETHGGEKTTGILDHRFEFLGAFSLSGPARLFSVKCRCSLDTERYGDQSLVLNVLEYREASRCEIFKARVRAASILEHEAITPVLESGDADGIQYCLLSFPSEFETLRTIMAQSGWLNIEDTIASRVIFQVSDALAHAHSKGVLHLAVRPEDILIGPSGRVLLTGFGSMPDEAGYSALAELADQIDPQYASPELLRGEPVNERSDVYSLGVTLYEMLTDRIPTAINTRSNRVRSRPVIAPHLIVDGISIEVSRVIMKMLEDDPANRFESIAVFQAALIGAIGASQPAEQVITASDSWLDLMSTPVGLVSLPVSFDEPDLLTLFEETESVEIGNLVPDGDSEQPCVKKQCQTETASERLAAEAEILLPS